MTTLDTLIDYKQLVEALADAVIIADPSGAIRFWNPAAERLFGFTEAEALSHSLDLIVPERFRDRHWAGYNRTMATGQSRYARDVLRVPAVHKDGRALSIAFTIGLLYGPQGNVTGILALIRDERTNDATTIHKIGLVKATSFDGVQAKPVGVKAHGLGITGITSNVDQSAGNC